jgi:ubiquinone/menaquinone biosynthesis C-methylase UbiE
MVFNKARSLDRDGNSQRQIEHNVAVHDRVARKYEALHGEIFNDVEQARLRAALARATAEVRTGAEPVHALDFGCGSGNVTSHLLALGARVTAADVSPRFLELVRRRFPSERLDTLPLNGRDLSSVRDESFDLVATYSVLHHIPDYLGAVAEMARVCRKGGVVIIDHELTDEYWGRDPVYRAFLEAGLRFDWRKYLRPVNYLHRLRRIRNPRYANEGDIHIWPDDHIEWAKIRAVAASAGLQVVHEEDYLLFRKLYRPDVYQRFLGRCTDTKVMILRKA